MAPFSFFTFDFLRVKRQVAARARTTPTLQEAMVLPLRLTPTLSLPVLPGMYLTTRRRPTRAITGLDSAGAGFTGSAGSGLLGGSGTIGSGTSGFGVGAGRLTIVISTASKLPSSLVAVMRTFGS